MIYFLNKGKRNSVKLIFKTFIEYFGINDYLESSYSTGYMQNIIDFLLNKVLDMSITAEK